MKSIKIYSQAEYEANQDFDGILVIKSPIEVIELRGNASAVLWENARADALDNSSVLTYNDNPVRCLGNGTVKKYVPPAYDRSVLDIFPEHDGDALVLYKSVNPDTLCDYYTGTIKYAPGTTVECPDWDPDPSRQCGGGLHLCFSALGTLAYNRGTVLKCLVQPEDLVIYSEDVSKVRCRKVSGVGVVDLHGRPVEG